MMMSLDYTFYKRNHFISKKSCKRAVIIVIFNINKTYSAQSARARLRSKRSGRRAHVARETVELTSRVRVAVICRSRATVYHIQ